ncbi:MAG TPA: ROK family protein [Bryobacteraceae bacterium]|nr:ROK family protein [Bryobacteraceae bacterium]
MSKAGGIEAGGSKFVCAIGSGPDGLDSVEIPTTTPEETLGRVIEFFGQRGPVEAVGIGSFGPIDPDPQSATFGYIMSTPKLAWRNFDLAGAIRERLHVKVAFDTDVNAAALGEFRWGAAQGLQTFLYLTVGTGVGGGGMLEGRLLHGRRHPEMGHIRIPHDRERDPFPGNCPYHGDCLEGLAAAPAIEARWRQSPNDLPDGHPAWELEAHYLALGIANLSLVLSPQRIILGGGIMRRKELYPMVRAKVSALLNGYIEAPEIVPPGLGERAGVLGAIALAQTALQ